MIVRVSPSKEQLQPPPARNLEVGGFDDQVNAVLVHNEQLRPSEVAIYNPVPLAEEDGAWARPRQGDNSMPEVYGSIPTYGVGVPMWRKMWQFIGPGVMISVGYMDPGNWSTDIAGGSAFGYDLLFIVLLASLLAMFLQSLTVKVGYATRRDLAQCCRDSYPYYLVVVLWIVQEIAIIACDLAEVIGCAVALKLLFRCPLIAGVWVTALDVLIVLFATGKRFRIIEGIVGLLVILITACFAAQIAISHPDPTAVMKGFAPSSNLFTVPGEMFIAAGIVGATVMPHNLYLHSSLVLTRNVDVNDVEATKSAIRYSVIDTIVSLMCALFVNAAILIVAATTFHGNGYTDIATLEEAYTLLSPILGSSAASTIFAVALLCSGQNSTLTGTLAGQIICEGFMNWKIRPVYRRVGTRLIAIIPAVVVVSVGGDSAVNILLIWSQVRII